MKRLTWLIVLLYLMAGHCVQASVVYVSKNAPGPTHDGTSWATAFITVQAAVDAAAPGDEVWVAESAPRLPAGIAGIPDLARTLAAGVAQLIYETRSGKSGSSFLHGSTRGKGETS
jgi:hypothetical protein